ncbi:hypothetical protein DXV76_12610 [Rhodobacteraceae bacterium CCMM004]|nr:hypothetical protein DXV76_12610 [Rhodobacteraceae bacterium CCMM004]
MAPGLIAVALAAAWALGTGLIGWAVVRGRRRAAALRTHAAEAGLEVSEEAGSGGRVLCLRHPAEGWTITAYRSRSASDGGGTGPGRRGYWTEWAAPAPATDGGFAVLGPALPPQAAARAGRVMTLMGGHVGDLFLAGIARGLGAEAEGLASVPHQPAPEVGVLLSTPGAEAALTPILAHPALRESRRGRSEMRQPVVLFGPGGLRVRVRAPLTDGADAAHLADLGRALADALRGDQPASA